MEATWWLIPFVCLVVIEMITLGLTTIWFAAGSLVSFFAALLGADFYVQMILFVVVSLLLLFFTRPIAKKFFNSKVVRTNTDSLIGMKAKVTVEINNNNNQGYAIVRGQEWTARTEDDSEVIATGEMVTIKAISGVKLIVTGKTEE